MNNYSLNQILNLIRTVALNHPQINYCFWGELSEISASDQIVYPMAWLNFTDTSISEKTLNIPIEIIVADLATADNRNEMDISSDTLQIATDLISALQNPIYQDDFYIKSNITLSQIREGLPDLVNGWRFTINFEVRYISDRCSIPNKI